MEQLSPVNLDDYLNELLAELRRAEGGDDLNTPSPPPPTPEHDYHQQQQQPQPGKEMSKMNAMLSAAEDWGELTRNDAEADIGTSRPDLDGQVYNPVPGEGSCIDCEQPFGSSNSTCRPGFCTADLFKDVPSFPSPEPGSEQQLLDAQKHGLEVRDSATATESTELSLLQERTALLSNTDCKFRLCPCMSHTYMGRMGGERFRDCREKQRGGRF